MIGFTSVGNHHEPLEYDSGTFDGCFSFQAVWPFFKEEELDAHAGEMFRVLKPGARYACSEYLLTPHFDWDNEEHVTLHRAYLPTLAATQSMCSFEKRGMDRCGKGQNCRFELENRRGEAAGLIGTVRTDTLDVGQTLPSCPESGGPGLPPCADGRLHAPQARSTVVVLMSDYLQVWEEPLRGGYPDPSTLTLSGLERMRAWVKGQILEPPVSRLIGMRAGRSWRRHLHVRHSGKRVAS